MHYFIKLFILSIYLLWGLYHAYGEENKTFIAYSMKVAMAKVEEAQKRRDDFRKTQPDLFYLGGITKPWAVVLDGKTNDWILVGERDPKASVLTLDEWVTSLRARFIHPDKDPGVTIEPRPCIACVQSGKIESCRHNNQQEVRFFAGVDKTQFGQICFDADWLLKKIGFNLEKLPLERIKTYYDLSIEDAKKNKGYSRVSSRFWFYPIVNRVNVFGDVILLERFQMGVFTEVLYAEINGTPVKDINKVAFYPSEGFSRSFTDNYEYAAKQREVFESLRGLTRLAALAKGLTQSQVNKLTGLDFFLTNYPLQKTMTPQEVQVLKVTNREVGLEISGGVELMALALRLKGGDANALKELVLKTRETSGGNQLSWGFEIKMKDGQLAGVTLPEGLSDPGEIASLFQQAVFLRKKGLSDAAIECYNKLLSLNPNYAEAYNNLGVIYADIKRDFDRAIAYYTKAINNNPSLSQAHNNRGLAYRKKNNYEMAIDDYNKAVTANPRNSGAYNNRGVLFLIKGEYEKAANDFSKAIQIDPELTEAYNNRGLLYFAKGQYDLAISEYNTALKIDSFDVTSYMNRGNAYMQGKGAYEKAISDFNKALEISPKAEVYIFRAMAYAQGKNRYDLALQDLSRAIEINQSPEAYANRGLIFFYKGQYDKALDDYSRASNINPKYPEVYFNKALLYEKLNKKRAAIEEYKNFLKTALPQHIKQVENVRKRLIELGEIN